MRPWLRYSLYVLGAIVLLLALGTAWLLHSFDGERIKRIAADWLRTNHQRELVIDGPVTLQLWPQPALTLKAARLSEAGQPGQPFASIADAALSLRLEPLWRHREIEIDKVSARGIKLELRRDAQGQQQHRRFSRRWPLATARRSRVADPSCSKAWTWPMPNCRWTMRCVACTAGWRCSG